MNNSKQEVQLARHESHPSDAAMLQRQKKKSNYIVTTGVLPTCRVATFGVLFMTSYHKSSLKIDCTVTSLLIPRSFVTAIK